MATSRLYRSVLQALTGIPGDAGAYVAMTRGALDRILPISMPSPYLPALLASTGLPVRSIPVERDTRPAGKSAYSEWARLRLAYSGLSRMAWNAIEAPRGSEKRFTSRRAYRRRDPRGGRISRRTNGSSTRGARKTVFKFRIEAASGISRRRSASIRSRFAVPSERRGCRIVKRGGDSPVPVVR